MLNKILLIVIFSMASFTTVANEYEVIICNTCNSDTNYSNTARIIDNGVAVVINLDKREARAYQIIRSPRPQNPEEEIIFVGPIPLPTDVMPAINGYHELLTAFNNYRIANGLVNYSATYQVSNTTINTFPFEQNLLNTANGCGSPSHWSYPGIPNFPFLDACNAHDICYTTDRSKSSCDNEFLFNMKNIASTFMPTSWWETLSGKATIAYLISLQADVFYSAVANNSHALAAYCNSTLNANAAECALTSPLVGGTPVGYSTGGFVGITGHTVFQSCELWRFPNGNNGYYYLEKNCTFFSTP
jgi:hypothetical protein